MQQPKTVKAEPDIDMVVKSVVRLYELAEYLIDLRVPVLAHLARNPRKAQLVLSRVRDAARSLSMFGDVLERAIRQGGA